LEVASVVDISADEVAAVVDVSAFIVTFVHGGVKILSPQSCPALLSSSCWLPLFSVTPFFLSHLFFCHTPFFLSQVGIRM
jgi:hypothetical protein